MLDKAPDATQVVAAATSISAGAVAFHAQDFSMAVFGVPMMVVLAAFAGAMISLTFISVQGALRAIGLVASGTAAGGYLAPLVVKMAAVLVPGAPDISGADKPIAFLLGLAFQVGAPALFAWIKRKGGANNA